MARESLSHADLEVEGMLWSAARIAALVFSFSPRQKEKTKAAILAALQNRKTKAAILAALQTMRMP